MTQLTKGKAILYHLYPGILITIGFIILAPLMKSFGFPPQFAMMIAIVLIAIPILVAHLFAVKKTENKETLSEINGFTNRLPLHKLILYALGLVVFAFLIWGVTQPINQWITKTCLSWLPDWFTVQDLSGVGKQEIKITLICNLILNGLLAPYIEEFYFRGYLLPRMNAWGKNAFFINALLFSLYHFWQPYIYITLLLSLAPMTYLVWKTRDLRLGILTHCLLNVIGAILSFAMVS